MLKYKKDLDSSSASLSPNSLNCKMWLILLMETTIILKLLIFLKNSLIFIVYKVYSNTEKGM